MKAFSPAFFLIFISGFLFRLLYIHFADLWIDEIATWHQSLNWSLDEMQKYSVHSGYYLLCRFLSFGREEFLSTAAYGIGFFAYFLALFSLEKNGQESGVSTRDQQLLLSFWPPFFIFSSMIRPYSLSVGLLFFCRYLAETRRLNEKKRLLLFFVSAALATYTLYLSALFLVVIVLFSSGHNRRNNIFCLLSIPLVFFKATHYVLVQSIFHPPLIASTGARDNFLNPFWEIFVFFNFPSHLAMIFACVFLLLFLYGAWNQRELPMYLLATIILSLILRATHTSSFPRQSLFLLPFVIPGVARACRKLKRKSFSIALILLVLILPWSLTRSVKVNGSKQVADILRREKKIGDRLFVLSGFQAIPLYCYLKMSPIPLTTLKDPVTVPAFFGLPPQAILPSPKHFPAYAVKARRLWLWGQAPWMANLLKTWPLVKSWEIRSGGNGSRLLELRVHP
jgi:hypothetical protein